MKPMSRRTFLLRATEAGAALAGVGLIGRGVLERLSDNGADPQRWDAKAFAPPGRPRVAVVRAAGYDRDLESIVYDGLQTVGAQVAGRSVLLKPNFVEFDRGGVINTDPRLVAATAVALRRLGAGSIVVGEGPGHRRDTDYIVSSSGLLDVLGAVDVPFTDLNTAPLVARTLQSHYTPLGTVWLPKPVVDADIVVSMPKLKTHHWAGATLSLKNCFGCMPGRVYGWPKNVLHWAGIEQSILDVAGAVRPRLAIVDGIVGMEGNGPIQGSPRAAGVLVFSTDPVAADVTAARLMGFEPDRITYLTEAGRFLGQADRDKIVEVGEDVERSALDFAVLSPFESLKVGAKPPAKGPGGDAPA